MNWESKKILLTGGTGSFGKKFTEIMLNEYHPARLVIFSRDELKQFDMKKKYDDPCLRYFLGDVRNPERILQSTVDIDIIVHAAAMKQVPACEYNPEESVLTNVIGAKNIIDAAIKNMVGKVIAISSDKAVNPVNLYGATKLVAEKLFIQGNCYAGKKDIRFSCTRYGNVSGSRGSVIPLFREQKMSGKLTITDERMTRFLLTLDQGIRFVIKCIESMRGGEIFVPKLQAVKIMDIADVISPGCEKKFTGIRSGEKIHEIMISEDEARHTVEYDNMYIVKPEYPYWMSERDERGVNLPDGFKCSSDSIGFMGLPQIDELLKRTT